MSRGPAGRAAPTRHRHYRTLSNMTQLTTRAGAEGVRRLLKKAQRPKIAGGSRAVQQPTTHTLLPMHTLLTVSVQEQCVCTRVCTGAMRVRAAPHRPACFFVLAWACSRHTHHKTRTSLLLLPALVAASSARWVAADEPPPNAPFGLPPPDDKTRRISG